jgi:uncharacterized protein (DUF58 family)
MLDGATSGRVWVVPNGRTLGLFAVLVAMCYAGASQGNGAAYLLCFLLTSLAVISLVHAWANVQGLEVSVESIAPVFVGEEVIVRAIVTATTQQTHFGIRLLARPGSNLLTNAVIKAGAPSRIEVRFPAHKRGHYQKLELELASDYPLGFLTARQLITIALDYYIYPAPRGTMPWPRTLAPTRQPRDGTLHEGDDFGGTRLWRRGESQRHIDWKAAARAPVLLTKQWTGEVDEILHFDWAALPSLDNEARLSQLAKWIVAAEHSFETYELRLPGKTIRPARGDRHYHECLRSLAAFLEPSTGAIP